jgi:hydroxymethylglutaryl-CoA lyase
MPPMVTLEDESLRDGLQPEPLVCPTETKLEIFSALVRSGVRRIQVGSFVHPKYVPQMADTDELIARLPKYDDVLVTGLVLNRRGLERALACGLKHLSISTSVSDEHSRRNVRKPATEALAETTELIREAAAAGITVRSGAQCAFGCVYQGSIPADDVLRALEAMAGAGAGELSLADTTGMANPWQVAELVEETRRRIPELPLSLHLHNTRGLGLANMYAGYRAGVRIFDVATGGLGGCPFVKGATGNVPTEDAVNMFEQAGIQTGIQTEPLHDITLLLESLVGRSLPSHMGRIQKLSRPED